MYDTQIAEWVRKLLNHDIDAKTPLTAKECQKELKQIIKELKIE